MIKSSIFLFMLSNLLCFNAILADDSPNSSNPDETIYSFFNGEIFQYHCLFGFEPISGMFSGKPADEFDHEASPGVFGRAKFNYSIDGKVFALAHAGSYGQNSEFLDIVFQKRLADGANTVIAATSIRVGDSSVKSSVMLENLRLTVQCRLVDL